MIEALADGERFFRSCRVSNSGRPLDGGRATLARFMVRIDLAGWLPKWMARSGSGKEVPELFKQVRTLADSHRSTNSRRIAWSSK